MNSLVENISKNNPLQDLLSSENAVISTNDMIEFITSHMTYNPGELNSRPPLCGVPKLFISKFKLQFHLPFTTSVLDINIGQSLPIIFGPYLQCQHACNLHLI